MSNQTNVSCDDLEWYQSAGDRAYLPEYYIITPLYVTFGISGHSILLWALYQQSKKHVAYYYQLFVAISEVLEIITYAVYVTTFIWWSGTVHTGAEWYMSCYSCMWFAAHLATPLLNSFITTTLFLTVFMAGDRLTAVVRPFEYKLTNHRRRQVLALAAAILVGFPSSIFDCFRFYVEPAGNQYKIIFDSDYVDSYNGQALAHFRNALRIFGMCALVSFNTALVIVYRKRTTRVSPTIAIGKTPNDDPDKPLIWLTICQSVFNTLGVSCTVVFYITIYVIPAFYLCEGLLWSPVIDAIYQLTDIADFYVMLIVSRKIRRMICLSLPCSRKQLIEAGL